MKTKKIWIDDLKNGLIKEDVLALCIYSANKRAKNYRDRLVEYKDLRRSYREQGLYFEDKYHTYDNLNSKKQMYYAEKETLLSICKPLEIHVNCFDEYFLLYKIGNYSFHSPIKNTKQYNNLEIKDIGELVTEGKDINDLVSAQFVCKVCDKVKHNQLKVVG